MGSSEGNDVPKENRSVRRRIKDVRSTGERKKLSVKFAESDNVHEKEDKLKCCARDQYWLVRVLLLRGLAFIYCEFVVKRPEMNIHSV